MLIHVNPIFDGYHVDKHLFKSTNEDSVSTNWTVKIISRCSDVCYYSEQVFARRNA